MSRVRSGQVALITGASSGIGEGFARELHARGATVVVTARRAQRLAAFCEELNALRASSASFIVADLEEENGIRDLLAQIDPARIDILVSNAGRGSFGYFHELDIDAEERMLRLNVLGPHRLIHAIAKHMQQRRTGDIAIVSSIAAFQPLAFMATYAASKAVNLSLATALHYELREFGVRVLGICPGPVATEFAGVARVPGEFTGLPRESVDTVVQQSLAALERNAVYIIPGLRAKLLAYPGKFVPLWLSAALSARVLRRTLMKSRQRETEQ